MLLGAMSPSGMLVFKALVGSGNFISSQSFLDSVHTSINVKAIYTVDENNALVLV
jgi:hypothetical protein